METIGKRLLDLREKRKLSQRNVALKTNLTNSTISRVERGESIPEGKTLEILADFYNVSFEYLLKGSEAPAISIDPKLHALLNKVNKSPLHKEIYEKISMLSEEDLLFVKRILDTLSINDDAKHFIG